MDPDATLRVIGRCLAAGASVAAHRQALELFEWLNRGGFAPDWSAHPRAAGYVRRRFPV